MEQSYNWLPYQLSPSTPPPFNMPVKPYVDKLLRPTTHKLENGFIGNLNNKLTFDPFMDDPDGSTRYLPPHHRLLALDLLPRTSKGKYKRLSPPTESFVNTTPSPTQSPPYSLPTLFLQYGVETSLHFLPAGLLDEEEEEDFPCGSNCLMRFHYPESLVSHFWVVGLIYHLSLASRLTPFS
jgi:hypothetical protein